MKRIEHILMKPRKIPNKVILWGGTGQAKVIRPIIDYYGSKVDAIIDDTKKMISPFLDIKIYEGYKGFLEYIQDKIPNNIGFVVTIGNNSTCKNARVRIKLSKMLKEKGLIPVTIIHPSAHIYPSVKIGEGVQICAGATIIAESQINDYCIINTGANIDHECILEEGSEIGPNATLCGSVYLGKNSWVGANATILPRLRIGNNSVVGAGAVVTKSVPDRTTVVGNPARELYKNNKK